MIADHRVAFHNEILKHLAMKMSPRKSVVHFFISNKVGMKCSPYHLPLLAKLNIPEKLRYVLMYYNSERKELIQQEPLISEKTLLTLKTMIRIALN